MQWSTYLKRILWFLSFSALIKSSNGYKSREVFKYKCIDYPQEVCTETSNWCKWDSDRSLCLNNYDTVVFDNTYEFAQNAWLPMFYCVMCWLLLCVICDYIVFNTSPFYGLKKSIRLKCRIYIFEVILQTLCLIIMIGYEVLNIIYTPDQFNTVGPKQFKRMKAASFTVYIILVFMYMTEILVSPDMRWSLKLHHFTSITTILFGMSALHERQELDVYRVCVAIGIYPFTEQSVFIQLLMYRIYPYTGYALHVAGVVWYILTRLFCSGTLLACWIQWCTNPFVKEQFKDGIQWNKYSAYFLYFFYVFFANIVLNVTQFISISAVMHVMYSVKRNALMREELKSNPRIKELYDIFIGSCQGEVTELDLRAWHDFVTSQRLVIDRDVVELLWTSLGYTDGDSTMSWREFHKIFAKSVTKLSNVAVDKCVRAKMRRMFEGVEAASQFIEKQETERDRAKALGALKSEISALIHEREMRTKTKKKPIGGPVVARFFQKGGGGVSKRASIQVPRFFGRRKTEISVSGKSGRVASGDPALAGIAEMGGGGRHSRKNTETLDHVSVLEHDSLRESSKNSISGRRAGHNGLASTGSNLAAIAERTARNGAAAMDSDVEEEDNYESGGTPVPTTVEMPPATSSNARSNQFRSTMV